MQPTINNPLAFFSRFLFDGYLKLYYEFYEPEEMFKIFCERLVIDKEKKTKEIAYYKSDKFTGEDVLYEATEYFPDLLSGLLQQQRHIALQLIDEKLNSSTIDQQQSFVENLSYKIIKLITDFQERITDEEDYRIIKNCLKDLIKQVFNTYNHLKFGTAIKSLLKEPSSKIINQAFNMNQPYLTNINWLYENLKEEFIGNVDLEVFKKAFNGSEILSPQLICWTAKSTSSSTSKSLLIHFIDELIYKKIINEVKYPKKIIIELFANDDGSKINYNSLKSTGSQMLNHKKPSTRLLDNLNTILTDFKAFCHS